VLGPLESRLVTQRQLVISASGPLATLPFATLLTAPRPGEAPTWLVQRWALVQVPSVSAWLALREMQRNQPAPEPLLAWGDPTFSSQVAQSDRRKALAGGRSAAATLRYDELPPLPETRDELRAIATALKADPAHDLLLGSAATRASLLEASRSGRLARKKVVVFATHGLMAGELPGLTQPALALAATPSARPDDVLPHLLTLDDVLTLRLNADWVVLSACNTAAADGRAEEALSGLARGFFYAGSRSLLVTQWAIETESAKRLTSATFEHHARMRDASKAESLRQAMLALMAEPRYAHPAFWAPYMLVGDGAR
jgi:CHAT domain-containing protein